MFCLKVFTAVYDKCFWLLFVMTHFFFVIRGLRPANLNPRVRLCVTSVDDYRKKACDKALSLRFSGKYGKRKFFLLNLSRLKNANCYPK